MTTKSLWLFLLVFGMGVHSYTASAKSCALVSGGSVDINANDRTNQFSQGLSMAAKKFNSLGWDTVMLYGGAEVRCEIDWNDNRCINGDSTGTCCPFSVVANIEKDRINAFATRVGMEPSKILENTRTNFMATLEKFSRPEYGCDQVVLWVDTHGFMRAKSNNTKEYSSTSRDYKAHGWILSTEAPAYAEAKRTNRKDVLWSMLNVNDPQFLAALNKIKQNGIKIGFVDESCYSGGSVEVLKQYGCTMSAQNSAQTTTGSKVTQVFSTLSLGTTSFSMENLFLEVLNRHGQEDRNALTKGFNTSTSFAQSQPMISGDPARDELSEEFYKKVSLLMEVVDVSKKTFRMPRPAVDPIVHIEKGISLIKSDLALVGSKSAEFSDELDKIIADKDSIVQDRKTYLDVQNGSGGGTQVTQPDNSRLEVRTDEHEILGETDAEKEETLKKLDAVLESYVKAGQVQVLRIKGHLYPVSVEKGANGNIDTNTKGVRNFVKDNYKLLTVVDPKQRGSRAKKLARFYEDASVQIQEQLGPNGVDERNEIASGMNSSDAELGKLKSRLPVSNRPKVGDLSIGEARVMALEARMRNLHYRVAKNMLSSNSTSLESQQSDLLKQIQSCQSINFIQK